MKITMAGIDHKTASIDIRELLSISNTKVEQALKYIKRQKEINGIVLMSTCNRTEIYVSTEKELLVNPAKLICEFLDISFPQVSAYFVFREKKQALNHLMEVACGLESQIWGEDQVVSQVKQALQLARDAEVVDPYLETFFRNSISAAKKVKTNVLLKPVVSSVAYKAVETLGNQINLKDKKALVIGNGEMGRLAATLLIKEGAEVTVTLRQYKKGVILVPEGCGTVDYNQRYEYLEDAEILISATTSPHFTIEYEEIKNLSRIPNYFIDLSVPRDIEPSIQDIDGVVYYNVDDLVSVRDDNENTDKLSMIYEILAEYENKYYKWCEYKEKLMTEVTA